MESNTSVWTYYQPGYVPDEYVPYLREKVKDRNGNTVSVNTWEKNGCSGWVDEGMVRKGWGRRFMRMFDTDPCPPGLKDAGGSYCVRSDGNFEPVFYTNKAFIAKKQYWDGYADQRASRTKRTVSEQTDLRSVNPLTGQYTVYYKPVKSGSSTRYVSPNVNVKQQYDVSWNKEPFNKYAGLPTKDSLLG